jgi:hypothetical protein
MGEPKGLLVVPIGFNPSDDLRSLELDASDNLKVAFAAAAQGLVGPHGWISGAWQKNPLLLGYSGDDTQASINLNAVAGINVLALTAVPAGEIWIIQAIAAKDANNIVGTLTLQCVANGTPVPLISKAAPAVNEFVCWTGALVIKAGSFVRAVYTGVILNDDLEIYSHHVRIDIDQ